MVKEYLSQKGVEFVDKDVSRDLEAQKELVMDLKSQATPTIVIGDEVLIGFEQAKIDAALAKLEA